MKLDSVDETYSKKFGYFVEKLGFDDVPKEVMEKVKLHILDTLGVALASYGMDFAHIILEVSKSLGGLPKALSLAVVKGSLLLMSRWSMGRWPMVSTMMICIERLHSISVPLLFLQHLQYLRLKVNPARLRFLELLWVMR